MTVVLKVTSGNEFCDGGCEFAVVTLTPELAGLALRRIAGLREQRRLDAELDEEYYWAYLGLEYFSPWGEVTSTETESAGESVSLADRLSELRIEDKGIVTVPDSFQVPPSLVAAVECEEMIMREDSVAFWAIPKQASFYVQTVEIPRTMLEAVALTGPSNPRF